MEFDLELWLDDDGRQADGGFVFKYDETEFRHNICNRNPYLVVKDLHQIVDRLCKRIAKYNKKNIPDICRPVRQHYEQTVDRYLDHAKKDLLRKFIRSYYSSWLVINENHFI